eukprot:6578794-Ditylum_brightwellii.AAC.1
MNAWLSTGQQKRLFNGDTVDICLVCSMENKDWQHLFQCPCDDSKAIQQMAITQFNSDLTKYKTAPPIWNALYSK